MERDEAIRAVRARLAANEERLRQARVGREHIPEALDPLAAKYVNHVAQDRELLRQLEGSTP